MEDTRCSKGKVWTFEVIKNQDDETLKNSIIVFGSKSWKTVSVDLKNNFGVDRTPKQCRDRWCNYLKIDRFSSFFTEDEKNLIFKHFFEIGCKWSILSEIIQTKSENQIKNFLNSTIRRNIRKFNKGKIYQERINFSSLEILKINELKEILSADKQISISWFNSQFISQESKLIIEKLRMESLNKSFVKDFLVGELDMVLDSLLNNPLEQLFLVADFSNWYEELVR